MTQMTQISAKQVYDFLRDSDEDPKKLKVLMTRLAGITSSEKELLTAQQVSHIFEGSPSLRSAFEARQKTNS